MIGAGGVALSCEMPRVFWFVAEADVGKDDVVDVLLSVLDVSELEVDVRELLADVIGNVLDIDVGVVVRVGEADDATDVATVEVTDAATDGGVG